MGRIHDLHGLSNSRLLSVFFAEPLATSALATFADPPGFAHQVAGSGYNGVTEGSVLPAPSQNFAKGIADPPAHLPKLPTAVPQQLAHSASAETPQPPKDSPVNLPRSSQVAALQQATASKVEARQQLAKGSGSSASLPIPAESVKSGSSTSIFDTTQLKAASRRLVDGPERSNATSAQVAGQAVARTAAVTVADSRLEVTAGGKAGSMRHEAAGKMAATEPKQQFAIQPPPESEPDTAATLAATLQEAQAVPPLQQRRLRPTVEAIVREAGPEELGRATSGLARSLDDLLTASRAKLSPERVATMTPEDAPEMLAPVAQALRDVLRNASEVSGSLGRIQEASDDLLGRATHGEALLGEDGASALVPSPLAAEQPVRTAAIPCVVPYVEGPHGMPPQLAVPVQHFRRHARRRCGSFM